jgi:hypothetical protein
MWEENPTEHGFAPERELWLAVLAQCAEDLAGPEPAKGSKRWRIRQSALNWIESPTYSPGSFRWFATMCNWIPDMSGTRFLASRENKTKQIACGMESGKIGTVDTQTSGVIRFSSNVPL